MTTDVHADNASNEQWIDYDAEACVIGAGAAGLAAGKALAERGINIDWFEKGSMVGGLWQIDNDNGAVAAYRTLHLNSSRPRTQYPSYPMPSDWPDYPPHTLVAQYFEAFARDHGLLERISFNTEVRSVEPIAGPGPMGSSGWQVTTTTGPPRRYRYVVVANGHHSTPAVPDFPGTFTGVSLHTHDYRDPSIFADKDVVVVGVGNSGMDVACDAAKVARSVNVVTRHGVHVIPKYAFGKPVDQYATPIMGYVPFPVERVLYQAILRLSAGRPQDRGLPKPDHKLLSAHPTVSAEFYDRVGHGDIRIRPGIRSLEGRTVTFSDHSHVTADVLVYATGYSVELPFFDPDVVSVRNNELSLYQRVIDPERDGLFFIGFIQTVGSGIPLYEYQSEWVADLITGAAELPDASEMRQWIATDKQAMAKRYVRSQRHTMQVDYWRYIRAMKEARARRPNPSLTQRLGAAFAGLR